jgi:hypothetical protein
MAKKKAKKSKPKKAQKRGQEDANQLAYRIVRESTK